MQTRNNKDSRRRNAREVICVLAAAITICAVPFAALAQSPSTAAGKAEMSANPSHDATMKMDKSMAGKHEMKMHKSMEDMHKKMAAMPMTGNHDIDFAMMMVAHHQGAIDMAQAEVDAGKDPAMIKAAKKIIAAQKKEIAEFEVWLKKHPHPMK